VQDVKVQVIGLQPPQRAFESAQNILAAVSAGIRISGLCVEGKLRCDDRLIARSGFLNEFTQPGFTFAAGVKVCRIEEIPAAFSIDVENLPRSLLVSAPAVSHHTQAERRHFQACAAQRAIVIELFHVLPLESAKRDKLRPTQRAGIDDAAAGGIN